MWNDIKRVLCNKTIKVIVQLGVPVAIAIIQSLNIGVIWLLLMGIVYFIAIIFYSKMEKGVNEQLEEAREEKRNLEQTIRELQTDINKYKLKEKASAVTVATYNEILESYAMKLRTLCDSFGSKGITSTIQDWDEKLLYFEICKMCASSIKKLSGFDKGINVGYISYTKERKNSKNVEYVTMVAHNHMTVDSPNVLGEKRPLKKCHYYYAQLIKEKISTIEAIENHEKILDKFKQLQGHDSLDKYSQYIAVPVICPGNEKHGKKLMGILQVVILDDRKICETKEELLKFAENSVSQFGTLILLVHKIKKALIATAEYAKEN